MAPTLKRARNYAALVGCAAALVASGTVMVNSRPREDVINDQIPQAQRFADAVASQFEAGRTPAVMQRTVEGHGGLLNNLTFVFQAQQINYGPDDEDGGPEPLCEAGVNVYTVGGDGSRTIVANVRSRLYPCHSNTLGSAIPRLNYNDGVVGTLNGPRGRVKAWTPRVS